MAWPFYRKMKGKKGAIHKLFYFNSGLGLAKPLLYSFYLSFDVKTLYREDHPTIVGRIDIEHSRQEG